MERELSEGEPGSWATLPGDPRLDFMKVPEGKITKNRVHLDWYAPDREAEVERLIGLGATRLWDVKNEDFEWTAQLGARAFELPLDRIERAEFTRVSRRSAGLVLRLSDRSEVWLWLRTKDSHQLITRIEDIYSKS